MSYPPPPGIGNLPARPPAPASSAPGTSGFNRSGFKPAYGAAPTTYGPSAPPTTYQPAPQQYGAAAQTYGAAAPSYGPTIGPSAPPPSFGRGRGRGTYNNPQQTYGPQGYGASSAGRGGAFPAAAGTGADFDPEMAAQLAQWQSAYAPRTGTDEENAAYTAQLVAQQAAAEQAAAEADPSRRKKTAVREGGGKKWTDDTLLEWDPSHLRLFVGNLAGETTDDSLLKAFARWSSVQKARVIRDKRTNKSKGYGFVAFSSADDFFAAARDMNGKYIQSHPVVVRKANTEIKVTNVKDKNKRNNNNKNRNKSGSGAGHGGGGHDAGGAGHLGPHAGGGVTKPGQKTKNGLKLLG